MAPGDSHDGRDLRRRFGITDRAGHATLEDGRIATQERALGCVISDALGRQRGAKVGYQRIDGSGRPPAQDAAHSMNCYEVELYEING